MKKFKKIAFVICMSLLFGLTVAFLMRVMLGTLIDRLENVSYDWRYRLKYEGGEETGKYPDYGIYIIDIDEYSMSKMGNYWNWDRGYQARMLYALSRKFPAAIAYDVLFYKPEDVHHQARFSRALNEAAGDDSTLLPYAREFDERVVGAINYDTRFERAIARSGRVTLGIALAEESDYADLVSQVENRMTMEWHDSLNPASALVLHDSLLKRILHRKTIIDGVYPENARAARQIGHVNVVSKDEVIREIPLLYKFGDFDPVYLPMSIRIAATLFGTPNDEIVFEPDKYIDIGKPFKIFRDEDGALRFSYPDLTEAQFRMILDNREKIGALDEGERISISAFAALYRDRGGSDVYLEMRNGRASREFAAALIETDLRFDDMEIDDEEDIGGGVTVRRDSDEEWEAFDDNGVSFWMNALEIKTLSAISVNDIKLEEGENRKLLFYEFWVKRVNGVLITPIPAMRGDVMDELLADKSDPAESILPGGRRDFGKNARVPLRKGNIHTLTYFGRGGKTFPYASFYKIMESELKEPLEGRIFIVGSSSPALFDIKPVPHEKSYPAVEIHASILNSIFTGTFVRRLEEWQDILILVVAGFAIAFAAFMTKPLWASLFAAAAALAYLIAAFRIFETSLLWIEIIRPVLTIILTFSAAMAYRYMTEEKDRKFLQNTFKQYLSPELIDMMYTQKQKPKLGGDEGMRTAFFTDIEGFSTFSERLGSPTRLVELLNEYLTAMTDILLSRYGTLDKYEGDAIIAFFGAPVPIKDHAAQACRAALDMQEKLGELREKWCKEKCDRRCDERDNKCGDRCGEKDKWPDIVHKMRMRIGINTGKIVTGNMGSSTRMNYTMMGDAVNLAARLESAAKQYGVYTMISNFTYDMIKDEFEARIVDKITVVGKSEPVTVYELIGEKGKITQEKLDMLEDYDHGVKLYYDREFGSAKEYFLKSAQREQNRDGKTNPSKHFIEMCDVYINNPPGDDWDGVERLTSK